VLSVFARGKGLAAHSCQPFGLGLVLGTTWQSSDPECSPLKMHPWCTPIEPCRAWCVLCAECSMGTSACAPAQVASGGQVLRYSPGSWLLMFNGLARASAPPGTCSTGWHMLHLLAHVQWVATLADLPSACCDAHVQRVASVVSASMFNGWRLWLLHVLSECSMGCLLLSVVDVSWSWVTVPCPTWPCWFTSHTKG
jgi:hypothetical protein